jgi:hypothetical protein
MKAPFLIYLASHETPFFDITTNYGCPLQGGFFIATIPKANID